MEEVRQGQIAFAKDYFEDTLGRALEWHFDGMGRPRSRARSTWSR